MECTGVGVKPGLWTVDWTMDWTLDWNLDPKSFTSEVLVEPYTSQLPPILISVLVAFHLQVQGILLVGFCS